jgi:hypothetical protein
MKRIGFSPPYSRGYVNDTICKREAIIDSSPLSGEVLSSIYYIITEEPIESKRHTEDDTSSSLHAIF